MKRKMHFHRVPKVIEPVLMSIYSEISFRMKNLDKAKQLSQAAVIGGGFGGIACRSQAPAKR